VTEPEADASRPTALVVDDIEQNRVVLLGYLEADHRVLEADSGPAALDILEREPVDIVLLDVMMPGMTGFEVCQRIKETPRAGFLPVLLVTALDAREDRIAGLEAGADDFLSKPVDRQELKLRVRTFLRLREQERLIRQQVEELQQLDALKDDLVSLIVHDLRSPLSAVLVALELLQRKEPDPGLRRKAEIALASAGRLRDAVDDLLQVRLLEEGELIPQREPVPLGDLAREAAGTFADTAAKSRLELKVGVETEVVVAVDRKLVLRAVENLIANALKYSPRDETVDITVRGAGAGAEIDVADRGPGIPHAFKTTLFQKFGSVEAKRGAKRRGFGLGLYMVKLVAAAHGGSVLALDRQGGGTVFRLAIPGEGSQT